MMFMFAASRLVKEFNIKAKNRTDVSVQFRWVQDNTPGNPAWAIDDIKIDCFYPSVETFNHCGYKSISFEEAPE